MRILDIQDLFDGFTCIFIGTFGYPPMIGFGDLIIGQPNVFLL